MIRSLIMLTVFGGFLGVGLASAAPFIFALGYVWADAAQPQSIAWFLLNQIPVSLVLALASIGGYLLLDRRHPPRPGLLLILIVLFAGWITLTTFAWPVSPEAARTKWDWAFKSVIYAAFMPFVFRSRVQIEALLLVMVASLFMNIAPTGLKTMISGGGYGYNLGLMSGNALFGEGATLATFSLVTVPLLMFLRGNSVLSPGPRLARLGCDGAIVLALAAAIGTYERTGLVGMVALGGMLWLKSRRKMLMGAGLAVAAIGVAVVVSGAWKERISTIETYQSDVSAATRVAVWKWTLDFANENPLGGGFDSFRTNTIILPPAPGRPEPLVMYGRAFHSIYFEVLGEQGWLGLALYVAMFGTALWYLRRVAKTAAGVAELTWCAALARNLQIALAVFLACGSFIGVAYQPVPFYLLATSISLAEYARRAREGAETTRRAAGRRWRGPAPAQAA